MANGPNIAQSIVTAGQQEDDFAKTLGSALISSNKAVAQQTSMLSSLLDSSNSQETLDSVENLIVNLDNKSKWKPTTRPYVEGLKVNYIAKREAYNAFKFGVDEGNSILKGEVGTGDDGKSLNFNELINDHSLAMNLTPEELTVLQSRLLKVKSQVGLGEGMTYKGNGYDNSTVIAGLAQAEKVIESAIIGMATDGKIDETEARMVALGDAQSMRELKISV